MFIYLSGKKIVYLFISNEVLFKRTFKKWMDPVKSHWGRVLTVHFQALCYVFAAFASIVRVRLFDLNRSLWLILFKNSSWSTTVAM